MIKAVLFDLDGVLVDSFEAWWRLLAATARHFGCPPVSRDRFLRVYGQSTAADVSAFFRGQAESDIEAFYLTHFHEYTSYIQVDPTATTVVTSLREQGIKTAVITNTATAIARSVLEDAQIEFDAIIGSTDVSKAKPAPDMVHMACGILGVVPNEAYVIGDSRYDYQAALAAGAHFGGIGVRGGERVNQLTDVLSIVLN